MNDFAAAKADAKRLLRISRTGALATLDEGRPLATLVAVASDWDGAPLFLVSDLSRHARNLKDDPGASLLLSSEGGRGDPLNRPRLTLIGQVVMREGADGRTRYARRNPKSKLYIDFTDFTLRRLEIERIHFNGGFGRADPLGVGDLLAAGDAAALAAAEEDLLARTAALGPASLARLAGAPEEQSDWRAVGIDAEGLELARGGEAARADFEAPVFDPEGWFGALKRRASAA